MKINAETKYCQTCGIPLDIDYTLIPQHYYKIFFLST